MYRILRKPGKELERTKIYANYLILWSTAAAEDTGDDGEFTFDLQYILANCM